MTQKPITTLLTVTRMVFGFPSVQSDVVDIKDSITSLCFRGVRPNRLLSSRLVFGLRDYLVWLSIAELSRPPDSGIKYHRLA